MKKLIKPEIAFVGFDAADIIAASVFSFADKSIITKEDTVPDSTNFDGLEWNEFIG